MRKCYLCHLSTIATHSIPGPRKLRVCTACRSRLLNGTQLNRDKSLSRTGIILLYARLFGYLVTNRGKKLLLQLAGKK